MDNGWEKPRGCRRAVSDWLAVGTRTWPLSLLAAPIALFATSSSAAAADAVFPRGDGFYFSISKIVALLAVYLMWLVTCRWVDYDAEEVNLPGTRWNSLMFFTGLFGLLVVWLLP